MKLFWISILGTLISCSNERQPMVGRVGVLPAKPRCEIQSDHASCSFFVSKTNRYEIKFQLPNEPQTLELVGRNADSPCPTFVLFHAGNSKSTFDSCHESGRSLVQIFKVSETAIVLSAEGVALDSEGNVHTVSIPKTEFRVN